MNNATITNTKKRDVYHYHLDLLYSTNNKEMSQRITIPTANATVIIQIPPTTTIKTAERHQPYPPICYDNLHNHKASPEEYSCTTKYIWQSKRSYHSHSSRCKPYDTNSKCMTQR